MKRLLPVPVPPQPHVEGVQTIALPGGAEVLDLTLIDGVAHLLVAADPAQPPVDHCFQLCPVGGEIPALGRWVGPAYVHRDGRLLALFELPDA